MSRGCQKRQAAGLPFAFVSLRTTTVTWWSFRASAFVLFQHLRQEKSLTWFKRLYVISISFSWRSLLLTSFLRCHGSRRRQSLLLFSPLLNSNKGRSIVLISSTVGKKNSKISEMRCYHNYWPKIRTGKQTLKKQ